MYQRATSPALFTYYRYEHLPVPLMFKSQHFQYPFFIVSFQILEWSQKKKRKCAAVQNTYGPHWLYIFTELKFMAQYLLLLLLPSQQPTAGLQVGVGIREAVSPTCQIHKFKFLFWQTQPIKVSLSKILDPHRSVWPPSGVWGFQSQTNWGRDMRKRYCHSEKVHAIAQNASYLLHFDLLTWLIYSQGQQLMLQQLLWQSSSRQIR